MKTRLTILFASVLFVFVSCNEQPAADTKKPEAAAAPTAEELNKAAYWEIVKSFETGNTDSLGKYVAENTVSHGMPIPGINNQGLAGLKEMVAAIRSGYPDMKMNFHHVVADGDLVMAHASWSGTNSGPMGEYPATNKPVKDIHFAEVVRFENGKASEHWPVDDMVGMMTQLGLMPAMGPAPTPVSHPNFDRSAKVTGDDAKEAKMKEAYREVLKMIQSGNLDSLDKYLAADFKEHAQVPGMTFPDGIEGAKAAMTEWKKVFPDLSIEVKHVAAEGNVLMAFISTSGTFSQAIPGFPKATGTKVTVNGVDIIEFNAEGKASAHWDLSDNYSLYEQLGVIPKMDAAPAEAKK